MANISIRPAPLGKIIITAATKAGIKNICSNFLPTSTIPGDYFTPGAKPEAASDARARRIDIVCPNDSPGRIFIGNSAMDPTGVTDTDFLNVLFILDPGQSYTIENSQQPMPYHVGDYYAGSDVVGSFMFGDFDPS